MRDRLFGHTNTLSRTYSTCTALQRAQHAGWASCRDRVGYGAYTAAAAVGTTEVATYDTVVSHDKCVDGELGRAAPACLQTAVPLDSPPRCRHTSPPCQHPRPATRRRLCVTAVRPLEARDWLGYLPAVKACCQPSRLTRPGRCGRRCRLLAAMQDAHAPAVPSLRAHPHGCPHRRQQSALRSWPPCAAAARGAGRPVRVSCMRSCPVAAAAGFALRLRSEAQPARASRTRTLSRAGLSRQRLKLLRGRGARVYRALELKASTRTSCHRVASSHARQHAQRKEQGSAGVAKAILSVQWYFVGTALVTAEARRFVDSSLEHCIRYRRLTKQYSSHATLWVSSRCGCE